MTTKIAGALMDAGVDAESITETPDGVVTVRGASGGRIAVGEDGAGDWWDFTRYSPDDEIEGTDGGPDLRSVAAEVARLAGGVGDE